MISIEDCIALSGLDEEEILAIAEHEHIPEIAAAALGNYLMHQDHGAEIVRDMIVDDLREAMTRGDDRHARDLLMALRHFMTENKYHFMA